MIPHSTMVGASESMCDEERYSSLGPIDSAPSCIGQTSLAAGCSVLVAKVDRYALAHTVNHTSHQSNSTNDVSLGAFLAGSPPDWTDAYIPRSRIFILAPTA